LAAVVVAAGTVGAMAQMGAGGGDPSAAAMSKLTRVYGNLNFSATAVMTISGKQKMPPMSFDIAISGGKTRMLIDMTKMMSAGGASKGEMPDLGPMVTIVLPEKKIMYQILPNAKAYCETALTADATGDAKDSAKIERKTEGKETVEGHECEKVRNTVSARQ